MPYLLSNGDRFVTFVEWTAGRGPDDCARCVISLKKRTRRTKDRGPCVAALKALAAECFAPERLSGFGVGGFGDGLEESMASGGDFLDGVVEGCLVCH